jgi:hypothetical protein
MEVLLLNDKKFLNEIEQYFSSFTYQQDEIEMAVRMMTSGYKGSFVKYRLKECIKFKNSQEEQEFIDFFKSRKLIFPVGDRWYNLTPKCKKILKSYLAIRELRENAKEQQAV